MAERDLVPELLLTLPIGILLFAFLPGCVRLLNGLADRGNVRLQKHGITHHYSPKVDDAHLIGDMEEHELYDNMTSWKKRPTPMTRSATVSPTGEQRRLCMEEEDENEMRLPITQAARLLCSRSFGDFQKMTPGERRLLRMAKSSSYNDLTVCAEDMNQKLWGRRRVCALRQWQSTGDSPWASPVDDGTGAENVAGDTIVRQALHSVSMLN